MDEIILLISSLTLGMIMALLFFGGLWLTTKHLPSSPKPALLALGSFAARSMICLFGFYIIAGSGLTPLLLSLAGFVLTKIVLVRWLGLLPGREGGLNG